MVIVASVSDSNSVNMIPTVDKFQALSEVIQMMDALSLSGKLLVFYAFYTWDLYVLKQFHTILSCAFTIRYSFPEYLYEYCFKPAYFLCYK